MERNVFIRCDIPHDPNRLLFCDPRGRNDMIGGVPITQPGYSIPFLQEFKISGTFPLPGNFWISGSAQFYPAQEAVAGGSQDQWGGTHRGGELSGARPYSGNINYNVTPANVMDNLGIPRTEGISVPLVVGQRDAGGPRQTTSSTTRCSTRHGSGAAESRDAARFPALSFREPASSGAGSAPTGSWIAYPISWIAGARFASPAARGNSLLENGLRVFATHAGHARPAARSLPVHGLTSAPWRS